MSRTSSREIIVLNDNLANMSTPNGYLINSMSFSTENDKQKGVDLTHYTYKFLRTQNSYVREFLAEMLGTFLLISFGLAANAQRIFYSKSDDIEMNVHLASGIGVAMGIIVSGKVSGGHLNPAVSIANLIFGNLTWIKFLIYVLAQVLGAFIGSVMVFAIYKDALDAYDGGHRQLSGPNGTAGIFVTVPDRHVYLGGQIADQVFGTFLFVMCNIAISDTKNSRIEHTIKGLLIGLAIYLIGAGYAGNCGGAVNPARDFAPRVFLLIAGWGSGAFSMNSYFFWVPVVAPLVGGVFAAWIYAFFIRNHWPNDDNFALRNPAFSN